MTELGHPDFPCVQSYWSLDQDVEISPPLSGEHTTEVVVIGAGFSCLATAFGLIDAQQSFSVLKKAWHCIAGFAQK